MKLCSIKNSLLALPLVFLITGCAEKTLSVVHQRVFVYPDLNETSYSAIDKIDVITDVKLTGHVQKQDVFAVAGMMYQTASQTLTTSGLYNTTDIVWGNPEGAARLGELIRRKKSRHGYARYVTESNFSRAKLYLTVEAQIVNEQFTKQQTYTLIDTPFNVFYRSERRDYYVPNPPPLPPKHLRGEERKRAWKRYSKRLAAERSEWRKDIVLNRIRSHRHRVAYVRVPYSVPDKSREIRKEVSHPLSVFGTKLTGTLSLRMVDKNNKLIFSESYQLNDSHQTSEVVPHAPPTVLRLLTEAVRKKIQSNVARLTPRFENRPFYINADKSDERAAALLTQGPNTSIADLRTVRPFEDVLILLEPREEKDADDYNCIGIAYACIGDYPAALNAFEKGAAMKEIDVKTAKYIRDNVEAVQFLVANTQKQLPKARR